MNTIPTALPTLSAGAHAPGDGKACVMEYVSLLAGEPWTDSPACTHPVLARAARNVNDRLPDTERHHLVPLIGRLFGTAPTGTEHEQKVLSVRLACWSARQVLHLAANKDAALRAIETAEAWCEGRASADDCRVAASATHWTAAAEAAAHAATVETATAAEHPAAFAAAYAVSVGYEDYAVSIPAALVAILTGLLDEYDRLTGRTDHRIVTDTELAELAQAVTA